MAEEFDLDLDQLEQQIINNNKVEKRIKDLSEKVKITSEERDELAKAKQELEAERDRLSKERDFYSNFSDSTSKYPGAHEFKDRILEKVKAGYDVEDATLAVLAKEGKLSQPTPEPEKEIIAGGSAATNLPSKSEKSLDEMSKDEKRAALIEADAQGGLERLLKRG